MVATHNAQCFTRQELAEFASGSVDVDQLELMAAHIDTCVSCQATISNLEDQPDSFVAHLKQLPGQHEGVEDSVCQAVVDQLVQRHADPRQGTFELPPVPTSIGGYRVLELAGTGGMGMVYKAQHPKLKRLVAIKLLPVHRWTGPAAIARFEREMEVIGSLDHPNIVRASDAGDEAGMHYLVMDFVDGLDLSRLVRRVGPLGVADACEIVSQAAKGLAHVHEASLVHRDIKPSNVMVTQDGRVKILDLGLAMLSQQYLEGENNLTTIGQLMGTLDYMAPEQAADSHQVDTRADIYSLGATLFQLLTGQAPYGGARHTSLLKKVLALANAPVPSAREIRTEVPEELDQIIGKCLAKEPDQRFTNVDEVSDALSKFVADAHLTQLMRRAAEKPEPDRFLHSAWSMAAVFGQRKEPDKEKPEPAISGDGRRFGGLAQLLSASALFAFLVGAVVIFRLVTDRGELIVRSEDPNAHILVKRVDGQPVKELTLQQGQGKLTIRSGQYAVELASDADRWMLSQNQFTISRGDRVVLTVEQKPKGQHQPTAGSAMGMTGMAAGESMGEMSGSGGMMGGSMSMGPGEGMGGMMGGAGMGRVMPGMGGGMSSGMGGISNPGMGSAAGMPSTSGMETGSDMGMMPGVGGAMPGRMAPGATTMPGAMMGGAANSSGMASGGAMGPGVGSTAGMGAMMPGGMGSGAMGAGTVPEGGGAGGFASSAASNEELKSRLVYDGKSYNDWLVVLDTERSPQRLIDAVTAISVLAPEAGSEEAARALLRIMRAFGSKIMDDSPQGKLVQQTQNTLERLDPSGVAKAIASEIQQGNDRSREFLSMSVQHLLYIGNIPGYGPQPSDGLRTAMIQAVPDIMPMLLHMSHNSDLKISRWALEFVVVLATTLNLDGQKFPDVVKWLQEALKSEDKETRYEAALALSQLAADTEGLPDTLLQYMSDPMRRYYSLEAIGRLGSYAESIVPQLVEVLFKEAAAANTPGMGGGMSGFGGMGGAGTAFPGDFNAPGTPAEFAVLSTLEKLGQVKEAIPILRKYAEVEGPYKEYAKQMLEKLGAEANESAKTQEPPASQDQPTESAAPSVKR